MFRTTIVGVLLVGLVNLAGCTYEWEVRVRRGLDPNTGNLRVEEENTTTKFTIGTPPLPPWPIPRGDSPRIPPNVVGGDPDAGLGVVVNEDGRLTFLASAHIAANQLMVNGLEYSAPASGLPVSPEEADDFASKVGEDGACPIRVDSADQGVSLTLTFADRFSNVVGVINPFQHPAVAIDARVVGMDQADPVVVFRASGDRDSVMELARQAGFDEVPFAGRMWSLDAAKTLAGHGALRRALTAVLGSD